MAQTNFTPILLYASSTPTNVPSAGNLTNSAIGSEIAINIADKNLFFKDSGGTVNTVPIRQSSTSSNGWLSATDWNTFNGKAPATSGTSILYGNGSGGFSNATIGSGISFAGGVLSATGSGGTVTSVTGTSPVVSSGGTTPAISMAAANTTTNGYLTFTDWNTFNNKGSGTVTSVTGTAPVVSSGGATPAISMAAATSSVNGYLTSTDWTTFNNKGSGTVTSVAALTLGTTGTDLSSTVANGTTTPVITLNVPTASAVNRGALSATDWTTFNSKAPGVTFTTGYVPFGQGTTTLNQDAGLFWDNTNKYLGIGTVSPAFPLTVASSTTLAAGSPSLVLQGSNNTERIQIRSATATGGQAITVMFSSRGSITTPTVTLNGDALGYYQLGGYTGTTFARGAWMTSFADGDWSSTNRGSSISFSTTPNGSNTIAERVRFHASGGVSIGNTTDPGATNLSVTGTIVSATTIKTGGYTVATLPTGVTGATAYVTNALAPSYGATVVGGGAVTIPVFYNGANWIVA